MVIKPADQLNRRIPALRKHVRDLITGWLAADRFVPRSDAWMRSFDLDFSRELARQSLIGITWPREVGGQGATNVERLVVTEELLRAGAPVAAHWIGDRQIGPAILRHGNPQLVAEIIPGILSGTLVFCLGMSEPEAGSDLAAVRTRAVRDGDGWRITGHKIWTSHAHRATHAYVLARTGGHEPKHQGLSEFVVDMADERVSVEPILDLAGEHHFNEVRFDGVFVPGHRLIGGEGNAWRQVVEQLSLERGGPERVLSTYPLLTCLLATAAGQDQPDLRADVGQLVARLAVLRQLCWQVAAGVDSGRPQVQEAAVLKYLGNAFERDVVEATRKVRLVPDTDLWRMHADAQLASPGFGIRGGSADVLLSIISRQDARR